MEIWVTVGTILAVLVLGYLIGSIPTALIFGRLHGMDIRQYGSHNAGGTNVGRVIGKREGITVMAIDILKCYLPCLAVKLIVTYTRIPVVSYPRWDELLVNLCGLAIALGHTFPVYAHFKGGKAVACFAGYMLFVAPIIAFLGAAVFFLTLGLSKRVSLSSILGVPSCFLLSFIPMALDLTIIPETNRWNGGMLYAPSFLLHLSYLTTITIGVFTLLVLIRHLSNIRRLKAGVEPETHFKKSSSSQH
jgi:glycerol-3-phosphate acyltransferase PlsY